MGFLPQILPTLLADVIEATGVEAGLDVNVALGNPSAPLVALDVSLGGAGAALTLDAQILDQVSAGVSVGADLGLDPIPGSLAPVIEVSTDVALGTGSTAPASSDGSGVSIALPGEGVLETTVTIGNVGGLDVTLGSATGSTGTPATSVPVGTGAIDPIDNGGGAGTTGSTGTGAGVEVSVTTGTEETSGTTGTTGTTGAAVPGTSAGAPSNIGTTVPTPASAGSTDTIVTAPTETTTETGPDTGTSGAVSHSGVAWSSSMVDMSRDNWMEGSSGNDTVMGLAGNDTVYGHAGNDTVLGNQNNDRVYGGQGDDLCHGGRDDDFVSGDEGDDRIWGDFGDDTLDGGEGADTFFFTLNSGNDIILDFNAAEGDRLDFQGQTYAVADVGGTAVITLSGGGAVVLSGVSAASLDGSVFL